MKAHARARVGIIAIAVLLTLWCSPLRAGDTAVPEGPPANGVSLEIIPDAWPALSRVLGYEYNQKNHHEPPTLDGGGESRPAVDEAPASGKRKRYRVVGVVVRCGASCAAVEARLLDRTAGLGKSEPVKLKLGPRVELTRFFAVRDDPARPLRFEVLPATGDDPLAAVERKVGPGGRTTPNPYDARFVAAELNNERRIDEGYPSFPAALRVLSDVGRGIAGARVTLLHDQFGLIETGTTDEAGNWSGRLLGGAWTAIAFGVPRDDPKEGTVLRTPRVCYLMRGFDVGPESAARVVEIKADQSARVKAVDADGRTVPLERLSVTPHKIAEALRFADVHDRCAESFTFDIDAPLLAGTLDLLTNRGATYDLAAVVRPAEGVVALLRASGFTGDGDLPLVFAPSKMARYVLDPTTGFGGGKELRGRLTLLEAERQGIDLAATDLQTVYAPAGAVRIDLDYGLRNGDRVSFLPRKVEAKPGQLTDLTPRPPFNMGIFAKVSRGIQIMVAVTDGTGQIVGRLGSAGSVKALKATGETLFELPLESMTFQFPTGLERVDLKEVALEARLRIGTENLRGRPQIEMVRKYAAHGTWATIPRALEANADAFLKMVAKSCEGEKRILGGPAGPVGMDFEIFLPPGVGGMGGGGIIQLEINELTRFVHETDRLPYAYCHELGHNVGFGHDPYMLLAPAGVEEGMYGALGYRMKNGSALQQLFRYVEGRRHLDKGSWELGADIFGGLRLLYGPEVHRKMFDMRRAAEKALEAGGLSSIERIAVLYTLATGDNVAWLFRAYGWPVFDFRVAWGRSVAMTRGKGVAPLNADVAELAAVRRWWVQEPDGAASAAGGVTIGEVGQDEGAPAAQPTGADAPWTAVTWPTDFIALDQGRTPLPGSRSVRLFARIMAPQTMIAYIVATSDVALEIGLNGHAIARLDASPQLAQPVHDELMLDRKHAFPVLLLGGENTVELDALQVSGSRGFILGFCDDGGRALPVRLKPEGPDLEAKATEERKLKPEGPVANGGFEHGDGFPAGWIVGPGEPQGGIAPSIDRETPGEGARSLRMAVVKAGTGAVMQRVVVEPGALYRVKAKVRSDGKFDGDVYVSLFVGEVASPITKTEPVKNLGVRWVDVQGRFASQKRRVVYVCCWVKAKAGTVWFDDIELVREK